MVSFHFPSTGGRRPLAAVSVLLALWMPWSLHAQTERVILKADRALDGRGGVLEDVVLTIRDGRIEAVESRLDRAIEATHDLAGLTLLPGLIDTHVHIGMHFDADGRFHPDPAHETPAQTALYAMENAYATLMSGVTTIQSLGADADADLQIAIERGQLPGPRILTSLRPLGDWRGSEPSLRSMVKQHAAKGANVIKVLASKSIREGGVTTLSDGQLRAICSETRDLGLRSVVHAHSVDAARRAILAGCTTIEHGILLDRETLLLMAEHQTFYDPQLDLVFRIYAENRARYFGVGNYDEDGFAHMERAVESSLRVFRQALEIPGLQMIFGSDAVAGAHGRNVEELIYRVKIGGQSPSGAIVSATSLAARSLGLEEEIGSLAPGLRADVIGVERDPRKDITALERVAFVMKGGRVFKKSRR